MAEVNAAQVMALRNETNLPMMECKQALQECNGDKNAALEWLSKKHKGKMEARQDRETGEGRIAVHIDPSETRGAIVELRCETAPVAKNEMFMELVSGIAKVVAEGPNVSPTPEEIQAMKFPGANATVGDRMTEVYGKIRETMKVGKCRKVVGGYLSSYVHHDGKTGVLISLDRRPSSAEVGKDLCMHVVFSKPLAVRREEVPEAEVAKVRRLAEEAAREEGKPANIIPKIVEGRVNAFLAENTLLEQEHVKVDVYGRKKVQDVLKDAGVGTVSEVALLRVGA